MKIILSNGQVIQTSREIIERMVKESLAKRGLLREKQQAMPMEKTANSSLTKFKLKRFNKPQEASEDYVIEELNVVLSGYTKGDKLTKDGVVALFDAISKHAEANKYYVGITCDPNRREEEHNAEFLAVIACPNKDKANDMERTLSGEGYDAGGAVGNVHNSDSKKVYIYKKSPKTVE